MTRIKSLHEGFRRCGVAHSREWTEHPADRFSEAELARLKAEPKLLVEIVPDVPPPETPPEPPPEAKAEGKGKGKGK